MTTSEASEPKEIRKSLESLSTDRDLKALFVEKLNFKPRDAQLNIAKLLSPKVGKPVQELKIIAGHKDFDVIICSLDRLLKTYQRPIYKQLQTSHYHSLVVFTDPSRSEWHFSNLKYIKSREETEAEESTISRIRPFRRMVIGRNERLRTASERLVNIYVKEEDTGFSLHKKCDKAFDVSEVTRDFYNDFVYYYKEFRSSLETRNGLPRKEADQLTQTIFNRLLFLYYVQKKGFLNRDYRYLYNNFQECENNEQNYYQNFLIPLFKSLSYPDFNKQTLGQIPFLNGGLFQFQSREESVEISNNILKPAFEHLLESYNFTVREDTEFEQEIAIDPEMLGTIFEQLVLGLESKEFKDIPDPRRQSGSYYTPKFVVAFMVKQSLVEYLRDKCPELEHRLIKQIVFDVEVENLNVKEVEKVRDKLSEVKAVDPGVGSGAFPVGLLLKIVEIIEKIDRQFGFNECNRENYRYELKRKLIENNIYGVDNQERAVHLAELRLWLSLLVDIATDAPSDIPPLPNLDFHVITGDSLISKIDGKIPFDVEKQVRLNSEGEKLLDRFHALKVDFEDIQEPSKKKRQREKIKVAKKEIMKWFLQTRRKDLKRMMPFEDIEPQSKEEKRQEEISQKIETIDSLLDSIEKATETFKTFNWGLDFAEIMIKNGGFDIVIGNPPYGIKEKTSVKNEFKLGSKDSYGIFTGLGIRLLRTGGTLCYIMSDTWQTIRTHKELRDQLLTQTNTKYLISIPNDTFKATVNPGVYLFKKRHREEMRPGGDNWILAADFSPLSIEEGEVELALEILAAENPEKFDDTKDGLKRMSDKEMAIFAYKQKMIPRFSNHSFFIASPKLYRLMQDVSNKRKSSWFRGKQQDFFPTVEQMGLEEGAENPPIYSVDFNGKEIELVKLRDVADVVVGLQTGDNDYYLRQSEPKIKGAKKNYEVVDFDLVLEEDELNQVADSEPLRFAVIIAGIVKDIDSPRYGDLRVEFDENIVNVYEDDELLTISSSGNKSFKLESPHPLSGESFSILAQDRYFEGRYFVPYDKGGVSDIEEGWLPNYYVPTDYFINWSEKAVQRMQTLTIADRIRLYNENKEIQSHYENTTCAVIRNPSYYFREGISFSRTGEYCPTFREGGKSPFDTEGSMIFVDGNLSAILGLLSSILIRFLFKAFIDHTVHLQVEDVKKLPKPMRDDGNVAKLTRELIEKQNKELHYNYMTNEQQEIDRIVYKLYNLNERDIKEIENWFWRRYPKLAMAIEEKMQENKNT